MKYLLPALAGLLVSLSQPGVAADSPAHADLALASLDPLFEQFMRENHVPGLVYGVVVNGKLARVHAFGVQDRTSNTPVTTDTVFRIASMSKQFAALATLELRDAGKLSLDAPAEQYIPELRGWKYPTADSPKIRVRDLLSHGAGFVTDDPWGDRQIAMSETAFTKVLKEGVPFSRAPGMAYEYSNFGYALVGRLITNVSKSNYSDFVTNTLIKPLGMTSTGYDIAKVPAGRRAMGYRWEDDAWREEPTLGPGVFGAMGGIVTSANDYAKYVAWVLRAWPPRDDPEDKLLRRASVREITRPANYAFIATPLDPADCPRSDAYGFGVHAFSDCLLGVQFGHSGGLPGFGSNVLMLPNRGVGVFAFANGTYAPASRVVRAAANVLVRSGAFPERVALLPAALQAMADLVGKIYAAGDIMLEPEALAGNFLLDHEAAWRNTQLAAVKQTLGACRDPAPVANDTQMSLELAFPCEKGTLKVKLVLAPTPLPTFQILEFSAG